MKKAKPIPKKETADYNERSLVLKKQSAIAEIKTINKELNNFEADCKKMEADTITAANRSRKVGIHLQTLCGHEQMTLMFWNSHCEGKIDCSFEQAKNHISVARKMEKPAKTIADAAPFFQTLMFAGNLLESPEREEPQGRSTVSVLEGFFCKLTLFRQPWKKILNERPLEQWDSTALGKFLSETEWIFTERERAARLLNEAFKK